MPIIGVCWKSRDQNFELSFSGTEKDVAFIQRPDSSPSPKHTVIESSWKSKEHCLFLRVQGDSNCNI